jgi:hypothetical protein
MILTPGMKCKVLAALGQLADYVREDQDRETIMFNAAELMPMVTNQFAYYDREKWLKSEARAKKKSKTR